MAGRLNDPSQLREALAWRLFARAGVPASRHTFAKLALNATYMGLFSVVEQVDERYLKDRFGDNDEGNLRWAGVNLLIGSHGWPFTGRQFTNHEVWRDGHEQEELQKGEETALGILEYVRMRHDSARAQLAVLRREHPAGSSRAAFPVALEPVP